MGSVAPTVVRLKGVESCLARTESLEEAQRTINDEISPIDDVRSSGDYRLNTAKNLLRHWWHSRLSLTSEAHDA